MNQTQRNYALARIEEERKACQKFLRERLTEPAVRPNIHDMVQAIRDGSVKIHGQAGYRAVGYNGKGHVMSVFDMESLFRDARELPELGPALAELGQSGRGQGPHHAG